ncbi:MAG: hypothetical protein R2867_36135 [Caldilineaceae bacterium]
MTNPEHRRELAEILEIPEENIADHPGTPVARMADDDYLYCFLFMGTQFRRNMPRLGHWKQRIGRSFNIVIDPFLPDGALDHADVLLPPHHRAHGRDSAGRPHPATATAVDPTAPPGLVR